MHKTLLSVRNAISDHLLRVREELLYEIGTIEQSLCRWRVEQLLNCQGTSFECLLLLCRIKQGVECQSADRGRCRLYLLASLGTCSLHVLRAGLECFFVDTLPKSLRQVAIEDVQYHCKNTHGSEYLQELVPVA